MRLRAEVLRGGLYLAIRHGIVMPIGLVGLLVLSRAIGPADYGLYAAAAGIFEYLRGLCEWGVATYLVRREGEEREDEYALGFTLLVALGVAGAVIGLASLPLLERWIRIEGFGRVTGVMLPWLPLWLAGDVALARLERRLDFKRVAIIEVGTRLMFFAASLPLAVAGAGVWAAVGGWWAQNLLALVLQVRAARFRPRLHWDRAVAGRMLAYGFGFSVSGWVWDARGLVNPFIVGRYVGAEAVGAVALAGRFAEALSFIKNAAWRISLPALARLHGDRSRMTRAIGEGMLLQVLAIGPLLVGFGLVAPWAIPLALGRTWDAVAQIYPFLAFGLLTNALFSLHSSVLYTLGRNWDVVVFHLVHTALLAAAAWFLTPDLGVLGYGWAEVAAIASYSVVHGSVVQRVGRPAYGLAAIWWAGFALALFEPYLGWWALGGLLVPALTPATWRELARLARSVRG